MIWAEILDSGSLNLLPNYDNWNGYGKIIDCFNQKSLKNYISKETLVNSEILTISSRSNGTYSSLNDGWRVSSLVQDSQAAHVTSQCKKLKFIFPVEFSFLYPSSQIFVLLQTTLWSNWWQLLLTWQLHYVAWQCARIEYPITPLGLDIVLCISWCR